MTTERSADAALAQVRALVRAGRLDEARAIAIEGLHGERARLSLALAEGNHVEALRLARDLMKQGWGDPVVLATQLVHGPREDADTIAAAAALRLAVAFQRVGDEPASADAWEDLLGLLLAAGRAGDALETVRRAAAEGLIDGTPWRWLVMATIAAGDQESALALAQEAVTHVAGDVELWAVIAYLGVELGLDPDDVRGAIARAEAIDPRHPFVWLARARLARSEGDEVAAKHALETARSLGVTPTILAVLLEP